MAYEAAFRDPRFRPLTPTELSAIEIEISFLTPLKLVSCSHEVVFVRYG